MRKNESGYTVAELLMAIAGLGMVCLVLGGLYVGVHFLLKFW